MRTTRLLLCSTRGASSERLPLLRYLCSQPRPQRLSPSIVAPLRLPVETNRPPSPIVLTTTTARARPRRASSASTLRHPAARTASARSNAATFSVRGQRPAFTSRRNLFVPSLKLRSKPPFLPRLPPSIFRLPAPLPGGGAPRALVHRELDKGARPQRPLPAVQRRSEGVRRPQRLRQDSRCCGHDRARPCPPPTRGAPLSLGTPFACFREDRQWATSRYCIPVCFIFPLLTADCAESVLYTCGCARLAGAHLHLAYAQLERKEKEKALVEGAKAQLRAQQCVPLMPCGCASRCRSPCLSLLTRHLWAVLCARTPAEWNKS